MADGAERLRGAFSSERAVLVPYLMGGYPDLDTTRDAARAVADHAAVIEIGIPFSDPLADGPTIQTAGQHALDAGIRPDDILEMISDLRDGPPIVVMTYINLLLHRGARAFMERAAACGVAGMIVPDMPLDEGADVREAARRAGVAIVPLAAPTTSEARLAAIGAQADAFVYLVSVAGVTGGDVAVDEHLRAFIARARAAIDTPIVVGFGIRTPEQAAAVGELADGVVVGSQFVRTMGETTDPAARVAAVTESARALASALPTR